MKGHTMTDEELGREIEGVRASTWFIRPGATNAAMGARARELLAPEPLPEDVGALATWLEQLWNDHRYPKDGDLCSYLATALIRRYGAPPEVPSVPANNPGKTVWVDADLSELVRLTAETERLRAAVSDIALCRIPGIPDGCTVSIEAFAKFARNLAADTVGIKLTGDTSVQAEAPAARKVVQIAINPQTPNTAARLFAVDGDGNIWGRNIYGQSPWSAMPALPGRTGGTP